MFCGNRLFLRAILGFDCWSLSSLLPSSRFLEWKRESLNAHWTVVLNLASPWALLGNLHFHAGGGIHVNLNDLSKFLFKWKQSCCLPFILLYRGTGQAKCDTLYRKNYAQSFHSSSFCVQQLHKSIFAKYKCKKFIWQSNIFHWLIEINIKKDIAFNKWRWGRIKGDILEDFINTL